MTAVQRVTDDAAAERLAALLLRPGRDRPVVVISTPAGHGDPLIDVSTVVGEVGDLADIWIITTGPHSWTFSEHMPSLTQVYGGAGRVYPVGTEWIDNPYRSPLHFARDAEQGLRAAEKLVSDALRMAGAAGLTVNSTASSGRQRVTAEVKGLVSGRAIVRIDGVHANVAPELTLPGLPIERLLAKGMWVTGWHDPAASRFDVRDSLAPAEDVLRGYRIGEVVLVEVVQVEQSRASVRLHPAVTVELSRAEVTGNELDDLRTLMTPGEVARARVVATGPHWRLTMADVGDDDLAVAAPPLIPGGPAWLVESAPHDWSQPDTDTSTDAEPEPSPGSPDGLVPPGPRPQPEPLGATTRPPTPIAIPRPDPRVFDPRRRHLVAADGAAPRPAASAPPAPPTPPPVAPAASAASTMSLTIDALSRDRDRISTELDELRDQVRALTWERDELVRRDRKSRNQVEQQERQLGELRTKLRRAKKSRSTGTESTPGAPVFADAEQGFRHEVEAAWAMRFSVGEQADRPLGPYTLGPQFLSSLDEVSGVSRDKVVDVVVEILTGLAPELSGREVHMLRQSEGGNSPAWTRADNATCWRASLQVKTPQARRIHYWVLPGGGFELSRITLHDDMDP